METLEFYQKDLIKLFPFLIIAFIKTFNSCYNIDIYSKPWSNLYYYMNSSNYWYWYIDQDKYEYVDFIKQLYNFLTKHY